MSQMIDEQRLERLALVGTAQIADPMPLPDALQQGVPEGADAREHAALLAAGTMALMRKAGVRMLPPDAFVAWPIADTEPLPAVGPIGEHCLIAVVEANDKDLLGAYVAQLAERKLRIPSHLIVPLMEMAHGERSLQQHVITQCGSRGAWLAAKHPVWSKLIHPDTDATDHWGTGTIAQRTAHLRTLRSTDPATARDLLTGGIKQESAKDLVHLLDAFAIGLSTEDAEFLEPLLHAKSRDVRTTVAALLARIPGHPLPQALIQLTTPLIVLKGNLLLGRKLEITLPSAHDPAWTKLGIEPKNNLFPTERTAWLGQMLALIPPQHWTQVFDRNGTELVALAAKNEFADTLIAAWTEAALLHQHLPLIRALLDHGVKTGKLNHQQLRSLFTALRRDEQMALLLPLVKDTSREQDQQVLVAWMLDACTGDWSNELGTAVLQRIERIAPKPDDAGHWWLQLPTLFNATGCSLPPALADRTEKLLADLRDTSAPAFVKHLEQLVKRARLRQRMLASLNEPTTP